MRRLSNAANYSRLSIASGALLALAGGPRGRRAAATGLASVAATSAFVNLVVKPLGRRPRPDREAEEVPDARHVPMPASRSFPSGHTAAAVAFAGGVGERAPAGRGAATRAGGARRLFARPHRRPLSRRRARRRPARSDDRRHHRRRARRAALLSADRDELVDQREHLRGASRAGAGRRPGPCGCRDRRAVARASARTCRGRAAKLSPAPARDLADPRGHARGAGSLDLLRGRACRRPSRRTIQVLTAVVVDPVVVRPQARADHRTHRCRDGR